MLALHAGTARVDVVRAGWRNLHGGEDGELRLRCRRHTPHVIADMPVRHVVADPPGTLPGNTTAFLQVVSGEQRSDAELNNLMGDPTRTAGLPGPSPSPAGLSARAPGAIA